VNSDFYFVYDDGRNGTGSYFKDVFGLGPHGEEYMEIQMGLALYLSDDAATSGGVMGIGYNPFPDSETSYPSLIDEMFNHSLINSRLYSLWLNDIESGVGNILFGGIDTEKYYGTLYSSPVLEGPNGTITSFNISLTSLSIQPAKGDAIQFTDASFSTGVVLEAGTTNSYLPDAVVAKIYDVFEVILASDRFAYIDCKYSNSSTMTFGFVSGSSISVAYSDLVYTFSNYTPPSEVTFQNKCLFGIYSSAGDS
jgi:hypothetical protein